MDKQRFKNAVFATTVVTYIFGLFAREAYKDGHDFYQYLGPLAQTARYHGTSFSGALAGAFMVDHDLKKYSGYLGQKFESFANKNAEEVTLFVAGSLLTAFEAVSATLPNRSFDWSDMGAYGGALAIFYGITKATKPELRSELSR